MGLQIVVKAPSPSEVTAQLGELGERSEVFAMDPGLVGISIPTEVGDAVGEEAVKRKLAGVSHFILWEGKWNEPKKKWGFW